MLLIVFYNVSNAVLPAKAGIQIATTGSSRHSKVVIRSLECFYLDPRHLIVLSQSVLTHSNSFLARSK